MTEGSPDRRSAMAVLALALLLPLAQLLAPSNLDGNDQPGPVQECIDVARNGHWLIQRRPSGSLSTKPPMYPWLGGLAVGAIGRTDEWVFKLPIILACWVATALIWDLGRRSLGPWGGPLAAAFWLANYHTLKLLYLARTDMLVTMWVVLGLWCVHRRREAWKRDNPGGVGFVALFWASVAAAALTKGPPAVIPVLWLVLMIAAERGWRRARPAAQALGVVLAVATVLAWLVPVLRLHPEWLQTLNAEVAERITGTGTGAHRHTPAWAMPAYFAGRFAPWSVLALAAGGVLIVTWRWRVPGGWKARLGRVRTFVADRPLGWAVAWVLLVLIVFMIPKGRRADYLLPAYAGAAVLAAWPVVAAQQGLIGRTERRLIVGFLAALCIGGLAAGVAGAGVRTPPPLKFAELRDPPFPVGDGSFVQLVTRADRSTRAAMRTECVLAGAAAAVAGGVGVWLLRRGRVAPAGLASALAVAGILAVVRCSLYGPGEKRGGDYFPWIARAASLRPLGGESVPTVFYDEGYIPVQALMGRNEVTRDVSPPLLDGGGMLVTSGRGWRSLAGAYGERASVVLRTPRLDEAGVEVVVGWVAPRRSSSPGS